jgi:hypothetical protein
MSLYDRIDPKCPSKAKDCFAYIDTRCHALSNPTGYELYCPFYKTRTELKCEQEQVLERLAKLKAHG